MEAQRPATSPISIGIKFGLLVALASIVVDFLLRIVGLSVLVYSIVAGTAALVVTIVGVILAHKAFKQLNQGVMTYGQGVIITLTMMLISGVISALFNYLYVNYIDPDFVDRLKEEMIAFMERNRVSDEQIVKSTAQFEEMRPPFGKALFNGIRNGLIGGVVFGLIISAFTKRKPADFE